MKMITPGIRVRRRIDSNLKTFFETEDYYYFNNALKDLCEFYEVKVPKFQWYKSLNRGKAWGKTIETGEIHLISPNAWKAKKHSFTDVKYWLLTLYHEMYHYLHWINEEAKADAFARKMRKDL